MKGEGMLKVNRGEDFGQAEKRKRKKRDLGRNGKGLGHMIK
jgi:hypothetical protein